MKRMRSILAFLLVLAIAVFLAKITAQWLAERFLPERKAPAAAVTETTRPAEKETAPAVTLPPETQTTVATEPTMETAEITEAPDVYHFTEEEAQLLLKLGMSERGDTGCVDCIALVMRTALNRVESGRFASTLRGVIYSPDHFTPVAEGTFEDAVPNEACFEALDRIRKGWDESEGALYYEWCQGESWHSKNLNLLFSHCDTRFYS